MIEMVKYFARNTAAAYFFITLFILMGMPNEYNKSEGIIIAILLIAYANAALSMDKMKL